MTKEEWRNLRKEGIRRGEEIAKIVKELHPDAICVVPTFEACIVTLPQSDEDRADGAQVSLIYHTLHQKRKDISEKTLYKEVLKLYNEGSTVTIALDGEIIWD